MPDIDKIIAHYVSLRDKKAEIQERHKEELEPINEDMQTIEGALLKLMNEQNATSYKSKHGTAYIQRATNVGVQDWDAFLEFVLHTERYDLLTRAANKTQVLELDELPPGLKMSQFNKVNIRRS